MNRWRTTVGRLIVVLAVTSPAWSSYLNPEPMRTAQAADTAMARSTRTFMVKAYRGSRVEVELAELAASRASSEAVKQFAQQMIKDHGTARDEVAALAKGKGIEIADRLDKDQVSLKRRLGKLNGTAFDKAYMKAMVKDHRTDVSMFRAEAERGSDPDSRAWAAKTLPTLEGHLQKAEEVSRAVVASK